MEVLDPVARILREINVPICAKTRTSLTPLHRCTVLGQTESLKKYSTYLDAFDSLGNTALHYAVMLRNEDCVRSLLQLGSDPNLLQQVGENQTSNPGFAALHLACREYYAPIVEAIVRSEKTDINLKSRTGLAPLLVACKYFFFEAVQLLLGERKIEVNCTSKCGLTPLHVIALNSGPTGGQFMETENLLNDFSHPSFPGSSKEHVLLLIRHKCKMNAVDVYGRTALHLAAKEGSIPIVLALLENETKSVNLQDKLGNTPLHYAAAFGLLLSSSHLIQILLKFGANPTLENLQRERPGDIIQKLMATRLWSQKELLALRIGDRHLSMKAEQYKNANLAVQELLEAEGTIKRL